MLSSVRPVRARLSALFFAAILSVAAFTACNSGSAPDSQSEAPSSEEPDRSSSGSEPNGSEAPATIPVTAEFTETSSDQTTPTGAPDIATTATETVEEEEAMAAQPGRTAPPSPPMDMGGEVAGGASGNAQGLGALGEGDANRSRDRSGGARYDSDDDDSEATDSVYAAPSEDPAPMPEAEPAPEEVPSSGADSRSALRPIGNTNINLGGAQDFGLFRNRLEEGQVPRPGEFDAAGFFAEHHTPLPEPICGEQVCLQTMLGVMGDMATGEPVTMLQIGLNSPIIPDPTYRPPLSLAVVIDVSGSMASQEKIEFVRQGLEMLIDSMQDDDQISIITYSDDAEVVFEMASVMQNRTELREIVRELQARGGTNLNEGLSVGYQQVLANYDSGRQNRVILLSDGEPTVGVTSTSSILDTSSAFNSDGVGLTTIGMGSSFNVDLMRGLAEQGDGNFYFVENSGAVREVFSDEISYFTVPVAFDLTAEVRMGDMYELVEAHGSSMWEDTPEGGRLEQPSVFLAHRVSHADVTESGGRRGGGSALILELQPNTDHQDPNTMSAQIAEISVQFREPGTNRIVTDTVTIDYPNAPWILPSNGYFQGNDVGMVHKSFVMFGMYQAVAQACTAFHAGRGSEALGMLHRAVAVAADFNDTANGGAGDRDVELDIELLNNLIQVMQRNGAREPVAFQLPSDPWPADAT